MDLMNNVGPVTFNLPFQLPFDLPFATKDTLSSTTTVTLDKSDFQTLLRLTVIICTYLLFRPHLEKIFRGLTGREDPTAAQIQQRLKKIDQEKKTASSQKVYAVAGSQGDARTPAKDKATSGSGGKRSAKKKA